MVLSSWDLEVHAKETRQRAMREAETARRVNEASGHAARIQTTKRWVRPWHAGSLLLAWLALRGSRHGVAATADAGACQPPRLIPSECRPPLRRPIRAAEPYAGMGVIAHGQVASCPERPSLVKCC